MTRRARSLPPLWRSSITLATAERLAKPSIHGYERTAVFWPACFSAAWKCKPRMNTSAGTRNNARNLHFLTNNT
jgi:hypothetical protein